ncbi:MAG: hypothetical protein SFW36_05140 [Leptolyngbyaceae cyanobacterium bins.59]|nr:hypothetical protein [Leptolyngbyaceae cyanobacterium bins.59]
MVAFIKGIFGSKKKNEVEATPEVQPTQPAAAKSQAYFLDADEARTFGDVDYMRSARSVRRTFPAGQGEMEVIKQVSAMKMVVEGELVSEMPAPKTAETASEPPKMAGSSSEVGERRRTDTNMDMFRSMARNINKR